LHRTDTYTDARSTRENGAAAAPAKESLLKERLSALGRVSLPVYRLPERLQTGLRSLIDNPPQNIAVLPQTQSSTLKPFWIALCAAVGAFVWCFADTQQFRWGASERNMLCAGVLCAGCVGALSARAIFQRLKHRITPAVIFTPLYLIKVHGYTVEAHPTARLEHPKPEDLCRFDADCIRLRFTTGVLDINLTRTWRPPNLGYLLTAYNEFRAQLIKSDDRTQFDRLDVFNGLNKPVRHRWLALTLLLAAVGTSCGYGAFQYADRLNDRADDELRWNLAKEATNASEVRKYLAARPEGAHRTEAQSRIDQFYADARKSYLASADQENTAGVEAVLRMMEYAQRSGHYVVAVKFYSQNNISPTLESDLSRKYNVTTLVPLGTSFSDGANVRRQASVLHKTAETFQRVIPGDILDFEMTEGEPDEMQLEIEYSVSDNESLYYPVSQENRPEYQRNFYAGIAYEWNMTIRIPGHEPTTVAFSSRPASLFRVAYQRVSSSSYAGGAEPNATEVYSAMADSAFADFGDKLLARLSVRARQESF
jgi:hypothetical protein